MLLIPFFAGTVTSVRVGWQRERLRARAGSGGRARPLNLGSCAEVLHLEHSVEVDEEGGLEERGGYLEEVLGTFCAPPPLLHARYICGQRAVMYS